MSQTGASMSQHKYDASVGTVDMKLEVIVGSCLGPDSGGI